MVTDDEVYFASCMLDLKVNDDEVNCYCYDVVMSSIMMLHVHLVMMMLVMQLMRL